MGKSTDSGTDSDGLESTDLGVGTDGTPEWDNVCLLVSTWQKTEG
jgi:hypothetical protein